MPAINEVLQQGRYRIIRQFEQSGGTDAIYEAYDKNLEAKVVIKEIPVDFSKAETPAGQEALRAAFADEAKILKELKHESLLRINDYFTELDHQYLVMEAIDGNNLSELIEKDKDVSALSKLSNWTDQLLDALNYLHAQQPPVIHGDINPHNIKLSASGKIKLLASGIPQNLDARASVAAANQNFDTSSLHYLPLEQIWEGLDPASQKVITNSYDEKSEKILKQPTDVRSDIFALGATLYHLVTAQLPIDALERSIEILDGKSDPLPVPSELNPVVPADVSNVLMKALEIKRENRFDSAAVMRRDLQTAFAQVKTSGVQEAKKQEEAAAAVAAAASKEAALAEQKRAEQKRQLVEKQKLETKAEQQRQSELVKRQLREAETQRLKAEQRAAAEEAEKQFKQGIAPAETSSAESKDLIVEPKENTGAWWRMPAIGLAVIVCVGGILGFWFSQPSKTAESSPPASIVDKPAAEQAVQAEPLPNAAATPDISAAPTPSTDSSSSATTVSQVSVKNKPAQAAPAATAPPKIEKKTPVPTKTQQPKQAKAVTVDDIINDD